MTEREIKVIRAGATTVVSAVVLSAAIVLLVKNTGTEVRFDKPTDPSTKNLKGIGIALESYASDYEGLSLPVVDDDEKRVYIAPTGQGNTETDLET